MSIRTAISYVGPSGLLTDTPNSSPHLTSCEYMYGELAKPPTRITFCGYERNVVTLILFENSYPYIGQSTTILKCIFQTLLDSLERRLKERGHILAAMKSK